MGEAGPPRGAARTAVAFAAGLVVAVCLGFAIAGSGAIDPTSADETLGRVAVHEMRSGEGYYTAMDHALRVTNGPPKTGRDFRQPMMFAVWRLLPTDDAVWLCLVVLVAVAGLGIAVTSDAPLVAPVVAYYVLRSAHFDQQLLVEIWAGPLVVIAIASWRKGWYRTAACVGAGAVLVRELAALVLVGGLLSRRRDASPWLIGLVAAAIGVGTHFVLASRYASPDGTEATLIGTGGLARVFDMAGVGFNDRHLAGLIVWPAAWLRTLGDRDLLLFVGPLLALPALGLLVGRDYWGFVVVPALLLLALEGAWAAVMHVRRRLIHGQASLVGNP